MSMKDLNRDMPIYIPDEEKKRKRAGAQIGAAVGASVGGGVGAAPGERAQPAGDGGAVSEALGRIADYGEYTSPYQPGIDDKYGAVRSRKPFSYDLDSDPQWAAYQKQYTRLGQMAYDDTLAKLSARTGGLASSYAGSAAQQRYGDYMRQMTEKIPALYKLAYEMYADEASRDLADLNAIRGLDSDAYGRWKDGYGHLGDLYTRAVGERSYADARADKAAEEARAERLLAERLRRGRL